ncbi:MAG TPA: TRAP transporter small permease subunit [Gammaproteobacteria bacterium]|nr:TRAP transporter small permease subunit [Gammaproteobacteria bacterium]
MASVPHSTDSAPPEDLPFPAGPLRGLAKVTLAIAAAALGLLALVEAWQVFARYVLDAPAGWTEPVALLLLKITLLAGAAVGVRHETHFRFALGVQAAGPKWGRRLRAAGLLAAGAIGLVFAGWGASLMIAAWPVKAAGAQLSSGLYYLPFVAGGALFALFALERVLYRSGD